MTEKQVRAIYCTLMRGWLRHHEGIRSDYGSRRIARWDGGRDADGRTFRPVWPKLVEFLKKNHLPAEEFLKAQFFAARHKPPTPLQCCTRKAMENYEAYIAGQGGTVSVLQDQLESERVLARTTYILHRHLYGGTRKDIISRILKDSTLNLSDLFRYCLACSEGLEAEAGRWRSGAVRQYSASPEAYEEAWFGWIPDDIRKSFRTSSSV